MARSEIRERKENGGGRYTGRIHIGKFKAKLFKLEWSVNKGKDTPEIFSSIVLRKYSENAKVFNKY